ncbi:hypothetical protein POX_h09739 [Penicillium oxalicum]|uniref:hypothetical protein n=1 Tax=Penicillium oxalicum TaxID=69781 RepID=UPI0020B78844|nr:hypothetical protein POX_h09739 [Penicillium oxalicum]KAI2785974.1 hypothetical protein POX_h09739 [Penicillium oxalicum]
MRFFSTGILTVWSLCVDRATAECSAWQQQVNLSICNWEGVRANILRDSIYLDGGRLWLQQGYADGCVNQFNNGNFKGFIYSLNLSTSFNTSSDFLSVIKNETIAGGTANNLAPNYVDGVMFSNQDEFYLYGGLRQLTNSSESPPADEVLAFEGYQYGPYRNNWGPGWHSEKLSPNVTRYITNGAGVSAPSENLGFYFSGMRDTQWGPITYDQFNANITANTMITADMFQMREAKWTNQSLPTEILGRANAELVWVPVAESGVLVVVGGVVQPAQLEPTMGLNSSQIEISRRISPTFMKTVSVFDVKSQSWFLQNTTGDIPPQLTQFCSVLASAPDGSSHNIYIYGGYDGIDLNSAPSDDVYVLSLPSFQWMKVHNGTQTHGRSAHRCLKVYPDQMLALGGLRNDPTKCLDGGVIVAFNLNTLRFQDTYDPAIWSEYRVPGIITARIGGSSTGGANKTAPETWTNSSLAAIFARKYPKTIKNYWPYESANGTQAETSKQSEHHFPKWAAAVLGALLGLFLIGSVALGLWLWRRYQRKTQDSLPESFGKRDGPREADSTEVSHLMYGAGPTSPRPGPQSASTGQETRITEPSSIQGSFLTSISPRTVESGGGIVHELQDSSPVELATPYNVQSDTPVTDPISASNPSPVSPATPATLAGETGAATRAFHFRTPSTASSVPSLSIDTMIARRSHPQEPSEIKNRSFVGQKPGISEPDEGRQRMGGQTIFEEELYIRSGV